MTSRIQPLDVLFALKAIALTELLTGNQKRVAVAIIDHFNRKDGRCDPSIGTIAALLGISGRTVIRTLSRLEAIGFIRRFRHGGKFQRNSYEPVWGRFRQHDLEWNLRRKAHRDASRMSYTGGQECHVRGADGVTQTCPINQSKGTFSRGTVVNNTVDGSLPRDPKRLGKKENSSTTEVLSSIFHVKRTSSCNAAYDAAERRWSSDITRRYRADPTRHAHVLSAIDASVQHQATLAEMAKRGGGLGYILKHLEAAALQQRAEHD